MSEKNFYALTLQNQNLKRYDFERSDDRYLYTEDDAVRIVNLIRESVCSRRQAPSQQIILSKESLEKVFK